MSNNKIKKTMKKVMVILLLAVSMLASAKERPVDSLRLATVDNPVLQRLTPTLTTDYVMLGKATQHWFLGVQGGASSFLGKPIGCGDLFDRMTPAFNAYLGKWFSPNVGARLAFQGLKFKDRELLKNNYQLYHADIMYNVAHLFRSPSDHLPKWDFAPYIGAGLAHGKDILSNEGKLRNYQFALSYGIYTRYHVGERFFISGELGGFSTFQDFDDNGNRWKLGDNILSLSLGLGVNIGSPKWKHAIDANPYISQNDFLLSYTSQLEHDNQLLRNQQNIDRKTLDELKKILEIEGLLDKYGYLFDDGGNGKNNYRGLLSLRSRVKGMNTYSMPQILETKPNILNIPIYFFFQLGKAELTDDSQLINLDELAKVAIDHNLKIHIAGAADSATGSEDGNSSLSMARTRFIAKELKKRGVSTEKMKGVSLGGISDFSNPKDNRYSKVSLYLEIDEKQLND